MTLFYGTLNECTDKLFELIDFEKGIFPDFDFAVNVDPTCDSADEAYEGAEGWFGVKDFADKFDCDTISLMCAHYGGGGIRSLELGLESDEDEQKGDLMRMIGESAEEVGYGFCEPDDYMVFEILEGDGEDER